VTCRTVIAWHYYRHADYIGIHEVIMLDLTGIMFSSIMMLMVIIRAVRMDQAQPWFQTIKLREKPADKQKRTWRRTG